MSITITVRLYRQHDFDLITLLADETINLKKLMRETIIQFANNEEIEAYTFAEPTDMQGYIPTTCRFSLTFSDKNSVALIENIKKGYRCSFAKTLFRNVCINLPLSEFLLTSKFKLRKGYTHEERLEMDKLNEDKSIAKENDNIANISDNEEILNKENDSKTENMNENISDIKINDSDNKELDDLFNKFDDMF